MDTLAIFAMNAGLLAQNYAEWRAGGPNPPSKLLSISGTIEASAYAKSMALVLVSVIVAGGSLLGLWLEANWLIAAIAAALITNALFQLGASIRAGLLIPGTVTGMLLMLPTSIWALATTSYPISWGAVLAGPLVSIPILVFVWWLSILLTRSAP